MRPVRVQWWRDGRDGFLEESLNRRIQLYLLDRGGAVLQLADVRLEDAGVYYCRVTHNVAGNGTGTNLVVFVPPTPLKLVKLAEDGSAFPLTLLCTTAAFSPDNLNITWYKNDSEIATGVEHVKLQNAIGLYEVSSNLTETEPVQSGTVYTCQVSHISLRTPANVSYTFNKL
ncbi:hypothetical protein chiPu_0021734, partial [Chiloscyllium punctatum]|nr:hypothetical protein [Chiloscyllium punctatum]